MKNEQSGFMKAAERYVKAWNSYWYEVAKNKKLGIMHMTKKRKDMIYFGLFKQTAKEKRLKLELDKAGEELEIKGKAFRISLGLREAKA